MTEERALQELGELIEAYSRRLHKLRVRVALAGRDARPEDLIEIEDIEEKLKAFEQQRQELVDARRPLSAEEEDRFTSEAQELERRISGVEKRLPLAVSFLNRLNELRDAKTRLSLPRYPPVTVVSGPMGYGKTHLLHAVADDLKKDEWDCILLECEKLVDRKNARAVMSALASEFGCGSVADWADIGACLGQRVTGQPVYKAALLVDGINWLPEGVRHQVLVGLDTIYKGVKAAIGECRIVLSGRCIKSDLDRLAKQLAGEDTLPFEQPGAWYSEIPLSEFDQDAVVDLIRRVAQRHFELWEYEVMSKYLLEITGGHPKGLVDIVVEDLHNRGWAFERRRGTRRFYFTPETNERLFITYMTDVVNEMRAKIEEQWWEDFQTVCVLRRFNPPILKYLIDAGVIRQFTGGEELLRWLTKRNLVREEQPGMWGDAAIARGVVVAELKMVARNRKRYRELNQIAAEGFSQLLDEVCSGYKMTSLSELETYIIAYGRELVYHRLEAEKPLQESLQEMRSKLVPLGDRMVERFIEAVTKDQEICPSQETRDMVANSFAECSE